MRYTPQIIIAFALIVFCFGFFFTIITMRLTPDQNTIANNVSTALVSLITMVIGYFFGSSKSSSDKNETIKNLTKDEINT